jgi:hypothetical protein
MAQNDKKTDVLLSLLEDAQESIRLIDSKVGVVIILLTGIIALFITDADYFIIYFDKYSLLLKIIVIISAGGIIMSICLIAKIILPYNNPVDKIPKPYRNYPNIYQGKNSANNRLIVNNFDEALVNDENINHALELEYLKTSFIRNAKTKTFNKLVIVCILTLAFTVGQFAIKKIEGKRHMIMEGKCSTK